MPALPSLPLCRLRGRQRRWRGLGRCGRGCARSWTRCDGGSATRGAAGGARAAGMGVRSAAGRAGGGGARGGWEQGGPAVGFQGLRWGVPAGWGGCGRQQLCAASDVGKPAGTDGIVGGRGGRGWARLRVGLRAGVCRGGGQGGLESPTCTPPQHAVALSEGMRVPLHAWVRLKRPTPTPPSPIFPLRPLAHSANPLSSPLPLTAALLT